MLEYGLDAQVRAAAGVFLGQLLLSDPTYDWLKDSCVQGSEYLLKNDNEEYMDSFLLPSDDVQLWTIMKKGGGAGGGTCQGGGLRPPLTLTLRVCYLSSSFCLT